MRVDLDRPISVQITKTFSAIRIDNITIRPSEDTGYVQVNYTILDNQGNEVESDVLWIQPEITTKEIQLTPEEVQQARQENADDITQSSIVQQKIDQIRQQPDCYGIVSVEVQTLPPVPNQEAHEQGLTVLVRYRTGDFFKLALTPCRNKKLHECLINTIVNYIKNVLQQKFSQQQSS